MLCYDRKRVPKRKVDSDSLSGKELEELDLESCHAQPSEKRCASITLPESLIILHSLHQAKSLPSRHER